MLTESLEVVAEYSGPAYDFDGVRYLDVLPDGSVLAADKYRHSIKLIGPDGQLEATLGTGKPAEGIGVFRTPEGVDSRDGTVWLSGSGNNRVVIYRLKP